MSIDTPSFSCGFLFHFEFVADSQHTTIVIPFNLIAAFVQLSNGSGAAKVEGNHKIFFMLLVVLLMNIG